MFAQMAQQQQPPQGIPPQILQLLMQQGWTPPHAPMPQQPSQGMPQGAIPPQGGSSMPQGSMPPSPQGSPPQGAGGIPPQILQMLMAQAQKQAPQQLASQGVNGDSLIAHLTPGEMMVPPEIQTPKVLATLDKAYKEKHVKPQQFQAGNPASSMNPKTGVPEYNFMSAFLPAALGVAGAAAAPFTGGASLGLSPLALGAIGGGLGSAAGGLLTGQTPTQAAVTGLGSAGGSMLGGGALSSIGGAGATGAGAGETISPQLAAADSSLTNPISQAAGSAANPAAGATPAFGDNAFGNIMQKYLPGSTPMSAAGGALGGYIGGQLGAPPKSNGPNYPAGFNTPMPAPGSLGSAQQLLGQNNSPQPLPTFTNYNPATNSPAAYNFGF